MKQKKGFRQILIYIILTLVVSLLGMGVFKRSAFYESSDRGFFGFFSMLRYSLIDYPIKTVTNFSKDIATSWDLRYENDALREQLAFSHQWQTRVKELENEVFELKELNGLKGLHTDMSLVQAKVMNRSLETWDSALTIDLGSDDGVAVGDGVITPYGIVGRVISVTQGQSIVSLITANNDYSQVSVKIEIASGRFVQGIVNSYNNDTGLFTVKLMETSSSILPEMLVSTSGMGGIFPAGLLMGSVDSVKAVADSAGFIVYVKSLVDFNDIQYVSVVKKS
ncbi:MAG: rod shape-determining protein MreC [Erysipelothrix sp.]|nr:rod shape-determining protein MreC [Erysipelothrix sp.]